MTDPILVFPRVVIRDLDPTSGDNVSTGFVEGNVWVNRVTQKIYTCTDRTNGVWVEMVTISSSAGGDINFDIAPANFLVNAGNITLRETGDLRLTGESISINVDALDPPTDNCYFGIYRGEVEPRAQLRWNENANRWECGVYQNLWPIVTAVTMTRNPLPTDYDDHFVGQTWINLVTQQKYTCVSRVGGVATWRLALTSAPTKSIIEPDDHIILYGSDDDTYTKIHWDTFLEWVKYGIGLDSMPQLADYGFQQDALSNIMPSEEASILSGYFEEDGDGNLTPRNAPFTDPSDPFFELDGNDDIVLKDL